MAKEVAKKNNRKGGVNALETLEGSKEVLTAELARIQKLTDKANVEMDELDNHIKAWKAAKVQAKDKMERKRFTDGLSESAEAAMDDLFKMADVRLAAYEVAKSRRSEQLAELSKNKKIMTSLQSRMAHLEFRDSMRLDMASDQYLEEVSVPGADIDFREVSREIQRVGHVLDALQEIQSGDFEKVAGGDARKSITEA